MGLMRAQAVLLFMTIAVALVQTSLLGWWWMIIWLWWLTGYERLERVLWLGVVGGVLIDIFQAEITGVSGLIVVAFIAGLWILKAYISQAVWVEWLWVTAAVAAATAVKGQLDLVQVILLPLVGLLITNLTSRFEREGIRLR